MSIPAFHECMLPILKLASDKNEHTNFEMIEYLVKYFNLSEEEKNIRLPSGSQYLIYNRAIWAKTYLKKARLITDTSRSIFEITERGQEVLMEDPQSLTVKFLKKFDEFRDFTTSPKNEKNKSINSTDLIIAHDMTPEEAIEYGYEKMNENISSEILDLVKNNSPKFFENLVVQLLVKMGYGGSLKEAAEVVGNTGDEGIDGLIKEDRLGLDIVYVQAKRWTVNNVDRPEMQKFVGALAGKKSKKGIFITTSSFTKGAIEYVRNIEHNVVLIDGEKLSDLMNEYGLGVSSHKIVEIKQIDYDFFSEI